ncbi:hypothetical protein BJY01DRAFT_220143 [Aspergillus pseudoustus]|uniref:Uncharacterized protein n=1 Tax=Aspergillus pseudoustus TaxID=1810923 RepID=A0ABR4JE39_9EURO
MRSRPSAFVLCFFFRVPFPHPARATLHMRIPIKQTIPCLALSLSHLIFWRFQIRGRVFPL